MIRTRNAMCHVLLGLVLAILGSPRLASAETLFGLVDTGELFASVDNGDTWTLHASLPIADAVGLVAGASSAELYLASRSGVIFQSSDAGLSWVASGAVDASDLVALHMRPDGELLVLTRSGVVVASPDATTFTTRAALTAPNLTGLSRRPGPLYALAETGDVFRSNDDGTTWELRGTAPVPDAVDVVSLLESVYLITRTGDVWTSTDGGGDWNAVGTLSQVHTVGFIRSVFGGTFYATTREGAIARSSDGVEWSWVGMTGQLNVVALATDEAIVGVPEAEASPASMMLGRPRPNPVGRAAGDVFLDVESPLGGRLEIGIFDVSGRRVAVSERVIEGGTSRVSVDVSHVAPGVYFIRTGLGEHAVSRRIVVGR